MIPIEFMKVSYLEDLFDIYAMVFLRDDLHVTTEEVNPDN